MYQLQGVIRDYAWGHHQAIADILGHAAPGHPEAEYWLGAHPSAPGMATDCAVADDIASGNGGGVDAAARLDRLIGQERASMVGQPVAGRFAGLPYLLKILAAEKPLSIQAHPSLAEAKAGFTRENLQGIDIGAPNRSYRDDNHKPELICALTPFEAKCGFRSVGGSRRLLDLLAAQGLAPLVERLAGDQPDEVLLADTVAWLLRLSPDEATVLADAAAAAANNPSSTLLEEFEPEVRWTVRIAEEFPGDVGVLVALLLNHVSLAPGQAIFLEAGNLHSYLQGVGIELMANSDNVLRGGLTGKHIDVEELLGVVDYRPAAPPIQPANAAVHRFDVPIPEFGLTRLDSTIGPLGDPTFDVVGPEILLVTSGSVTAKAGDESGPCMTLTAGAAGFVPFSVGSYRLIDETPGELVAWRATVGDAFGA